MSNYRGPFAQPLNHSGQMQNYAAPNNWGTHTGNYHSPIDYQGLMNYGTGVVEPPADPSRWQNFRGNFFGSMDTNNQFQPGIGMQAVQMGTGLLGGYLGLKQYGMAKKQFKENRRQFNQNFNAQARTTNAQMEALQARRHAESPDQFRSPEEHMALYGIKER